MNDTNFTIISGTNRPESMTRKVANFYSSRLSLKLDDFKFLSLESLPLDLFNPNMYSANSNAAFDDLQKNLFA